MHSGLIFSVLVVGLAAWIGGTLYLIRVGCGKSTETDYMIRLPHA